MFKNREDAGHCLAERLRLVTLKNPLVLAIPRGGVSVGAVVAEELSAELDVVLSRKLRAPNQPELALGAISEDGQATLNAYVRSFIPLTDHYLKQEQDEQFSEIKKLKKLYRKVRPAAEIAGRSIVVTDDGIATGATMAAALKILLAQKPHEIVLAVPVSTPAALQEFQPYVDQVICLVTSDTFGTISEFYEDFSPVNNDEVANLLKQNYERIAIK